MVKVRFHTTLKELRYVLYLLTHPFKGFWEIQHEKCGSLFTAGILFALLILSSVFNGLYSGYIFNQNNGVNFDVIKNVLIISILFFSWCIANWCLTCLFDGEGSFQDILKATAYALTPLIMMNLLAIPLTNILSIREAAVYSFLINVGYFWTAVLIFISTVVTHQYGFFKTVIMILCIIVGVCIIFYIGLLFFNLIGQMAGFADNIIKEISNRV